MSLSILDSVLPSCEAEGWCIQLLMDSSCSASCITHPIKNVLLMHKNTLSPERHHRMFYSHLFRTMILRIITPSEYGMFHYVLEHSVCVNIW